MKPPLPELSWDERPVTVEEMRAFLARPSDPEEERGLLELVRWFTRRYDALGRLRYVTSTYRRWEASRGAAIGK